MASGSEVGDFFDRATSIIGSAIDRVMSDGVIAAAGRQGIDEIGVALKAFPDSIQVQESGSIWNPTQGEIAAARADDGIPAPGRLPSPSEIAADNRPYRPEQDLGNDLGNVR